MSVKKVEQTALSNNVNDCMHSSSNSVAFSSRSDSRVRRIPTPSLFFSNYVSLRRPHGRNAWSGLRIQLFSP